MGKDVTIKAPIATAGISIKPPVQGGHFTPPTAEEMVQLQDALLREKNQENGELKVAASTLTNVVACLTKILVDLGHGSGPNVIVIPREVSDYMEGARVTVGENRDKDLVVKYEERGPEFVAPAA